MADYQLQSSKFHVEQNFTVAGIVGPEEGFKLYGETSLHIAVQNATGQNSILIQGRLTGEKNVWQDISQVTGTGHFPFVNIGNYDYIRFNVLRISIAGDSTGKLIATGHFADFGTQIETEKLLKQQLELNRDLNCYVEELTLSIKNIEKHLQIVTGLDLNGD